MESCLSHQHLQTYVSILSHVGQVGQSWNPMCPVCLSILSHVGQVGQSYGILPVPPTPSILCVRPIPPVPNRTSGAVLWNPMCPVCLSYDKWDSPLESCLSHQHPQSYVSILSNLSHVGQVGQSYGILPIPPTPSIHVGQVGQSYVSVLPVLCRTSGTVLWNPTCPTNTLNPMCPSYPTCPM